MANEIKQVVEVEGLKYGVVYEYQPEFEEAPILFKEVKLLGNCHNPHSEDITLELERIYVLNEDNVATTVLENIHYTILKEHETCKLMN